MFFIKHINELYNTINYKANETQVKIWKIPSEGVTAHINTPLSTLALQKKVTTVQYHPVADNLLFTATGDFSAKYVKRKAIFLSVWDLC